MIPKEWGIGKETGEFEEFKEFKERIQEPGGSLRVASP
jgi:hypothetical protein